MPNTSLVNLSLVALLLAASAHDLAARKIPNRLLLAGLACALLLHLASGAPLVRLADAALGFGLAMLLFLPMYAAGGMAAGDVKLMATVGAFTGPGLAFQICLATCCIGGLMALGLILMKGKVRATIANLRALLGPLFLRLLGVPMVAEPLAGPSVGGMPYGLAIALGTFVMLWWRHR